MYKLTPDQADALHSVANEIALFRFTCHGLNCGFSLGENEVNGLHGMLDRWHGILSLALAGEPEGDTTHV